MWKAMQIASSRNQPPNAFTLNNPAQPSIFQSSGPAAVQSHRSRKHAEVSHTETPESAGDVQQLALPPEILALILGFIRDRKNMASIRLVCAVWEAVVARQAWSTFITDFQPSHKQDLAVLLHPNCRILPHVRRLIVCNAPGLFPRDSEMALRRFLECMPRGALKGFVSMSPLSPSVFKDLIAWHPNLERFEAFVDPVLEEFKQCDWMLPRLSEVKLYQLWIKRWTEEHSLDVHQKLISGLSNLEELDIFYEPRRVYRAPDNLFIDISSVFDRSMRFSRLSTLSLCGVDMRQCSARLLERFDVSKLRRLHLLDCSYASVFMEHLSDWYVRHGGALERFHFRYTYHSSMTTGKVLCTPLQRFIMTCPALSDLRIEYRDHVVLPVHCIIQHRRTLQHLNMGMDSWPLRPALSESEAPPYTAQDLEAILRACPLLKTLGFDMPFAAVDLGSIDNPQGSFELARQAPGEVQVLPEFENMLSIIAQHRNIHTLRMLNLPKISFNDGTQFHPLLIGENDTREIAKECQHVMQIFADEVFRFLASCNSAVQFLNIKPTLRPAMPARWDENGHQWPVYAYRASQTSCNGDTVSWSKPCKLHYSAKAVL